MNIKSFRTMSGWLALASLLFASAVSADGGADQKLLAPHSAEYKVKILVLSGKLKTTLTRTENGYKAERITTPTGMAKLVKSGTIEEVSEFSLVDNGVRPLTYYSNDEISKEAGETRISFDWDAMQATASHNATEVSGEIEDLSHDRLSIQFELMYDLVNELDMDSYVLFEVDKIRELGITMIGEKKVRVPAGKYTVVGIRHQAEGSSRATTMWCAKELGYLPVIIERHRKGKLQMRAKLSKYRAL